MTLIPCIIFPEPCETIMELFYSSLVVCSLCSWNSNGVYVFKGTRGLDNLLITVGGVVLCLMAEISCTLEYLDK